MTPLIYVPMTPKEIAERRKALLQGTDYDAKEAEPEEDAATIKRSEKKRPRPAKQTPSLEDMIVSMKKSKNGETRILGNMTDAYYQSLQRKRPKLSMKEIENEVYQYVMQNYSQE